MEGKTAAEVVDHAEVNLIFMAYKGNGGGLSYEQIERKFGLRQSRGMTAYRIIKNAAKARPDDYKVRNDPEPTPKPDDDMEDFNAVDCMLASREWRQEEKRA